MSELIKAKLIWWEELMARQPMESDERALALIAALRIALEATNELRNEYTEDTSPEAQIIDEMEQAIAEKLEVVTGATRAPKVLQSRSRQ